MRKSFSKINKHLQKFVETYTIKSNVYKMTGRSVSVYTDTSASHEYLCTLIQNGHEFCKLLIKRTQNSQVFKLHLKINVKNLKNWEKNLCKSGPFCISVYRQ